MKNRLTCLFLSLLMLLAAIPTAHAFSDTDGHWAKDYIDQVVIDGLFTGMSENEFMPNHTMSRAMFVTVLGRFEGIDPAYWSSDSAPVFFKQDVDELAYYAPYVSWAVCNGIVNGMNDVLFAPNDPVTREQMAKMIAYYVEKMGYDLRESDNTVPEQFADGNQIAAWAAPSVEALRASGILNGLPNADGSVSFCPKNTATRAEAAAVFCRIEKAIIKDDHSAVLPTSITLNMYEATLDLGESVQLAAMVLPQEASVLWRSSDSSIVKVDETGLVTAVGAGITTVSAYTSNGLSATCTIICTSDYPNASFTKAEKCNFVFGQYVSDPRTYYPDSASARADMVFVDVRTWDIGANGEKYTRTWQLEVHKKLAPTVKAIFEEIYNGEEKFPICALGGWRWANKSEHSIGAAIDINPEQNYYCDPNGNALVGKYWKPYEDPYSITPDGDLVRAFKKYGFIWGVNWNSGYKDYMHFSFFGT